MQILNRNEMKYIIAGSSCRVAFRDSEGSFAGYSTCMDCGTAQEMYNSGFYDNDSGLYASGYCGASCGGSDFPNATPCAA